MFSPDNSDKCSTEQSLCMNEMQCMNKIRLFEHWLLFEKWFVHQKMTRSHEFPFRNVLKEHSFLIVEK